MPDETRARVAVVTDSAATIPAALVQEYNIGIVPYELLWDGQAYLDGQELTAAEFYRRFRQSDTYPTTSQPTLASFIKVYAQAAQQADAIVSIHVAERLTTAIQVARRAAEHVSPTSVRVIDCYTAAAPQGFVVLAAARAAKAGASLDEVVSAAKACAKRVGMYFTLPTLKHLRRGGRIGQAAALWGSRLGIQPILNLAEGQVRPVGVTRSRQQAKARILQEVERRVGQAPIRASVFHADVSEEADLLAQQVQQRFHCVEFFISEFTPVMGAHTGPGIIGVGFCLEDGEM